MKSIIFAIALMFIAISSAMAAKQYLVIIGGSTAPGATSGVAITTLSFATSEACTKAASAIKGTNQVVIQTYCVDQ